MTRGMVTAQLVIFDLDGTLTDSAEGIVASFRHALERVGATVPDGDLPARLVGPPVHTTLRTPGLGENTEESLAAYYSDYAARGWAMNKPFDGINTALVGWGYGQAGFPDGRGEGATHVAAAAEPRRVLGV